MQQLAPGVYEGEDESDNDCFGPADIRVRVQITVSKSGMHVDFTGSSPQIAGFKNSSIANTYSSVYLAVIAFLAPHLPKNDGAFRPITVVAPEGTIVNARPPAPMTMNTVFPATNIVHACWKALAACDPSACLRRLGQVAALRDVRADAEGRNLRDVSLAWTSGGRGRSGPRRISDDGNRADALRAAFAERGSLRTAISRHHPEI